MRRKGVCALALALAATASVAGAAGAGPGASSGEACEVSHADRAWLAGAVSAWQFTSRRLLGATLPRTIHAIFFDSACTLSSTTALTGGDDHWTGHRHGAQVQLPNGTGVPIAPTSFTSSNEDGTYFVMALPSVWSGQVDPGRIALDPFVTAVMMHEASHVAQQATYGERMVQLSRRWQLPDSFGDDSIQDRFAANRDFSRSVARETALLLAAADSPDRARALKLAREARQLLRRRQHRWYPAKDGYLAPAEDIWLTMEGSGQWAGYRWLTSARSGVLHAAAYAGFARRGHSWTQLEGLALFLAIERLSGAGWTRDVFGAARRTALQWLDAALR
jgi:hypothetical protein